jgi:hypothetical protein
MLRLRHQSRALLAVLFLAVLIPGCKQEYENDYEVEVVTAQLESRLEPGVPDSVQLWGEVSKRVYDGKAGEVITLSITTEIPGLDPNVRLVDPAGLELAFDDDSGVEGHALIQDYLLASDGTYEVRVETDEDQHGEVTVLLSRKGDVKGTMESPWGRISLRPPSRTDP